MSDNYKKLDRLRDFILGWIHEEACNNKPDEEVLRDSEEYEKRRKNLNMLAGPDIEYINTLIRKRRYNKLTKAEMQKCNALRKKYSAISDVEFEEIEE